MFSDRETRRLKDILENSDAALEYVAGLSFEAFAADRMRVDATERCIERITEAVVQIGEQRFAEVAPDVSVAQLRGMGNRLRHEYGYIDTRTVFETTVDELPSLRDACMRALKA